MRMLLLPSRRNVGCHLLPLRQLPVPAPAVVVGRVVAHRRHNAPRKFETTVCCCFAAYQGIPPSLSHWALWNPQVLPRLDTVSAATSTLRHCATLSSSISTSPSELSSYCNQLHSRTPSSINSSGVLEDIQRRVRTSHRHYRVRRQKLTTQKQP